MSKAATVSACAAYVKFNNGLGRFEARCPCGWRGSPQGLKFASRIDAKNHNRIAANRSTAR